MNVELIETLCPSQAKGREKNGRNAFGVCCVAYKMAIRDAKPYRVGPTAYGYAINNAWPYGIPFYEVHPDGRIFKHTLDPR